MKNGYFIVPLFLIKLDKTRLHFATLKRQILLYLVTVDLTGFGIDSPLIQSTHQSGASAFRFVLIMVLCNSLMRQKLTSPPLGFESQIK